MSSLVHSGQEAVVPTEQADNPAGHTPGPWFWAVDSSNQHTALMRSGTGGYIATAQADISDYGLRVDPWIDLSEVDACLIAAAPDLLKALKALVDLDLTYNGPTIVIPAASHADAIRLASEARAAIAKATGADQ